jgi:hypothetical protein
MAFGQVEEGGIVRFLERWSRGNFDGRAMEFYRLLEQACASQQPSTDVGRDRREPLVFRSRDQLVEVVECLERSVPVTDHSERIGEGEVAVAGDEWVRQVGIQKAAVGDVGSKFCFASVCQELGVPDLHHAPDAGWRQLDTLFEALRRSCEVPSGVANPARERKTAGANLVPLCAPHAFVCVAQRSVVVAAVVRNPAGELEPFHTSAKLDRPIGILAGASEIEAG